MRIRRSRLTADYVQIPNQTVRDDRLSYTARGVLAELLSRPDGWEASADDLWRLARQTRGSSGESRRAMRAAFAELKTAGYLVATREQLPGGRFGTVLTLHDVPAQTDVPPTGTPVPPGQTDVPAGRTDVPPDGTSEGCTDMPQGGTSAPRGETGVSAGSTDVPPTDVPHAGTSNRKRSKKTGEKTGGDGRRPTTGSRDRGPGGSAAPDKIGGRVRFADLGRVIQAFPPRLVDALEAEHPGGLPASVTDAIEGELRRGLTAEQMAVRVNDRWNLHGYALDADIEYGGRGLQRPTGVAVALVRRGECTHPRCNDGTDLDTGQECRTCERAREDAQAARTAARGPEAPALRPVPHSGPRDTAPPSEGVPGQMAMLLAVRDDDEHDQEQHEPARCAGCGKALLRPGRTVHVGCA